MNQLFAKYDLDRSGGLSKDEFIPAVNELFMNLNINKKLSPQDCQQLIYMMDTNKNKAIEKDEFAATVRKILMVWKWSIKYVFIWESSITMPNNKNCDRDIYTDASAHRRPQSQDLPEL